jgi:hypothetical protein
VTTSVSDLELAALIADLTTPTAPAPAPAATVEPCLDPFCSGLPGGGCGRPAGEHITHHGTPAIAAALRPAPARPAPAARSGLGTPARCPVTELLVDACDHCRPPPPAPARREPTGLGPWIAAKYAGECGGCGGEFGEGDRIRAGDGGWLAQCCGDVDADRSARFAGKACAYCNGTGGCQLCEPNGTTPPAPRATPGPPPSTVAEMREVLAELDASRPRSLQRTLGPSELGTPCQRQIAYKLAGAPRQLPDQRPPWAPMQGTAMHTLMEEALRFHNAQLGRERWVVEERLQIDDEIFGHGDAFDTDHACVVDWKYVGTTALKKVKRRSVPNDQLVSPDYRTQAHLYGYGHERAGREVRWVRLVLLARSHDYDQSAEWTERYDPEIAINALMRYYATHDLINALDLAANPGLWPVVPAVVSDDTCAWCPFKRTGGPADGTGCPGNTEAQAAKQLRGLIA